jgi:hypothetical protein
VRCRSPFIVPSSPVRSDSPPVGDQWLHEVKFDGYRVQLHIDGQHVTIFSKNGTDSPSGAALLLSLSLSTARSPRAIPKAIAIPMLIRKVKPRPVWCSPLQQRKESMQASVRARCVYGCVVGGGATASSRNRWFHISANFPCEATVMACHLRKQNQAERWDWAAGEGVGVNQKVARLLF